MADAHNHDPFEGLPEVPSLTVTSSDITHGDTLPQAQVSGVMGAGGQDHSPQLSWSDVPAGT